MRTTGERKLKEAAAEEEVGGPGTNNLIPGQWL